MTDDEWIWKRNMKIGTWNVRSLFWSGTLKVLHNELLNLDFDVVALQETRLESGIQKFDNFAIFNSGLKNKKHELGCGFYVKGEFLKYIKDFKAINEGLCWLRLKAKSFSCTLINVHAPTNEKMEETKENFIIYLNEL
jgi:exonuclease III